MSRLASGQSLGNLAADLCEFAATPFKATNTDNLQSRFKPEFFDLAFSY